MTLLSTKPHLIVHCDWGTEEPKRWMACARLGTDDHYTAEAPEPVGKLSSLLTRLHQRTPDSCPILIGFDFPIGIPAAYAKRTGEHSFLQMLPVLGSGKWNQFYEPANEIANVNKYRPFYPDKPGKKGEKPQQPFLDALGVSTTNDLRRLCERKQPGRGAASPLFWTVGGNQVGKAAIRGWREVITPALEDASVKIWPFSGSLETLLRQGKLVIAETYPTQYHQWIFGKHFRGKQYIDRRRAVAQQMIDWSYRQGFSLKPELGAKIREGFVQGKDDAFDAAIGLFGMIKVVLNPSLAGSHPDPTLTPIEGWILGQS